MFEKMVPTKHMNTAILTHSLIYHSSDSFASANCKLQMTRPIQIVRMQNCLWKWKLLIGQQDWIQASDWLRQSSPLKDRLWGMTLIVALFPGNCNPRPYLFSFISLLLHQDHHHLVLTMIRTLLCKISLIIRLRSSPQYWLSWYPWRLSRYPWRISWHPWQLSWHPWQMPWHSWFILLVDQRHHHIKVFHSLRLYFGRCLTGFPA